MPLVFVSVWAATMEMSAGSVTAGGAADCAAPSSAMETAGSCWSGWSQSPHLFYLIAAPMLVAYAVHT